MKWSQRNDRVIFLSFLIVASSASTTPTTSTHSTSESSNSTYVRKSTSRSSSRSRKRVRESVTAFEFPSVYSARVDKEELLTSFYKQKLAEIDLLRVECPSEQCRIQALLHSALELEYFNGIPWILDVDATKAFTPRKLHAHQPQQRSALELYDGGYSRIDGFPCYMDYQGTMKWLHDLVSNHNQSQSNVRLQLFDIGDSFQKTQNVDLDMILQY